MAYEILPIGYSRHNKARRVGVIHVGLELGFLPLQNPEFSVSHPITK